MLLSLVLLPLVLLPLVLLTLVLLTLVLLPLGLLPLELLPLLFLTLLFLTLLFLPLLLCIHRVRRKGAPYEPVAVVLVVHPERPLRHVQWLPHVSTRGRRGGRVAPQSRQVLVPMQLRLWRRRLVGVR